MSASSVKESDSSEASVLPHVPVNWPAWFCGVCIVIRFVLCRHLVVTFVVCQLGYRTPRRPPRGKQDIMETLDTGAALDKGDRAVAAASRR